MATECSPSSIVFCKQLNVKQKVFSKDFPSILSKHFKFLHLPHKADASLLFILLIFCKVTELQEVLNSNNVNERQPKLIISLVMKHTL